MVYQTFMTGMLYFAPSKKSSEKRIERKAAESEKRKRNAGFCWGSKKWDKELQKSDGK